MSVDGPDLKKRRKAPSAPKPAPDYGVDSAEVTPPAASNAPTQDTAESSTVDTDTVNQIPVPLNSRISFKHKAMLSKAQKETGKTIRALLEEAIAAQYE